MTIHTILQEYNVNLKHVCHVSDLALTIFDNLRDVHNLPRKTRHLLEVGALLHDIGMSTDPEQHHIVGRDIVLNVHFPSLDDDARAIVACLVAFHRKKVRPNHEPAYLRLNKKQRDIALRLAALLRIADGLDYSHTQSTSISDYKVSRKHVQVHLTGPHANEDSPRAIKKADLWRKVLGNELTLLIDEEPDSYTKKDTADTPPAVQPEWSALKALDDPELVTQPASLIRRPASHDPLAEVCLRMLRQSMRELLARERGVCEDRDPEYVHKMRVATRRLRAIMPIIAEVAPAKQVRHFRQHLKRLAGALGSVRDCDVFLAHIDTALAKLPEAERDGLSPLIAALHSDRAMAREQLLDVLRSDNYATFKADFAAFMTDSRDDWDTTLRVRDCVGSIIWQRYEALRAYEQVIPHDATTIDEADEPLLHDARIMGKRLRYMFELFAEVSGVQADKLIAPLARLQECLGGLQDSATARAYIAGLDRTNHHEEALERYVSQRKANRMELLGELPGRWSPIVSADYRRELLGLIGDL